MCRKLVYLLEIKGEIESHRDNPASRWFVVLPLGASAVGGIGLTLAMTLATALGPHGYEQREDKYSIGP
jgi:hypothetical protein